MFAFRDEDIGRLDIAMDDSLGVRCFKSIGDFNGKRQQGVGVKALRGDHMLHGHAVQVLHGDKSLIAALADFVNGADVGMIEGGSSASFAPETLERLRHHAPVRREEISMRRSGRVLYPRL